MEERDEGRLDVGSSGAGEDGGSRDDPGPGQGDAGSARPARGSGVLLALHSRLVGDAPAPRVGRRRDRAVLTGDSERLGGPQRFVADHLLTPSECRRLTDLLQVSHGGR